MSLIHEQPCFTLGARRRKQGTLSLSAKRRAATGRDAGFAAGSGLRGGLETGRFVTGLASLLRVYRNTPMAHMDMDMDMAHGHGVHV